MKQNLCSLCSQRGGNSWRLGFNFKCRYIDDVLSINKQSLRITWARCIPLNSRSKTRQRATLLLLTWIYFCRLGGAVNFTLPFMTNVTISISTSQISVPSSNISTSPAYGVFMSQLIRYARACSSYGCFILRATRLSNKLLEQGYVKERLKSSRGSYQTIWSFPLTNVKWNSVSWPYIKWQPPTDQTLYRIRPFTEVWPYYQISGGFHRTLQRVRLASRVRLLLRAPGPVPFETCICYNVETILFWICHVYGPFEFRTSLGASILLWEVSIEHLRRVWHADRGRLLLRTPGPVPLGLAYVLLVETNPFS